MTYGYVHRRLYGAFEFSAATYEADQGTTAIITVRRVDGVDGAVSVDYETEGGTAVPNTDYTPASGTLSWGAGDGADKTFQVQLTADDDPTEPVLTIGLVLSGAQGGAQIADGAATLQILPDLTSLLAMADAAASVTAGNGITLYAERVLNSTGAVSAAWVTAAGTGVPTVNFTPASGTVEWADGDTAPKAIGPIQALAASTELQYAAWDVAASSPAVVINGMQVTIAPAAMHRTALGDVAVPVPAAAGGDPMVHCFEVELLAKGTTNTGAWPTIGVVTAAFNPNSSAMGFAQSVCARLLGSVYNDRVQLCDGTFCGEISPQPIAVVGTKIGVVFTIYDHTNPLQFWLNMRLFIDGATDDAWVEENAFARAGNSIRFGFSRDTNNTGNVAVELFTSPDNMEFFSAYDAYGAIAMSEVRPIPVNFSVELSSPGGDAELFAPTSTLVTIQPAA